VASDDTVVIMEISNLQEDGNSDSTRTLVAVSFNMHGYNKGFPTAEELVKNFKPNVFMFQEHWLTPANLCLFQKQFTDYFAFGSSAMLSSIASGMLHGRPFGGVMTLISNNLRKYTETIYSDERFVIVKIGQHLFVNVYFPCSGTVERLVVYENVFCLTLLGGVIPTVTVNVLLPETLIVISMVLMLFR